MKHYFSIFAIVLFFSACGNRPGEPALPPDVNLVYPVEGIEIKSGDYIHIYATVEAKKGATPNRVDISFIELNTNNVLDTTIVTEFENPHFNFVMPYEVTEYTPLQINFRVQDSNGGKAEVIRHITMLP